MVDELIIASAAARCSILITCEHGGNTIPPQFANLFGNANEVLNSHRGYDLGAIELANDLAQALNGTLITANISRLLIDLNRSITHPSVYSEVTQNLSIAERQEIQNKYYWPYRRQVERHIATHASTGRPVLHIAAHSFTPVLAGQLRRADIGILYDPKRLGEAEFARRWQSKLRRADPKLRVRRNYPYLGIADGFPTALRKHYDETCYLGFELEFNQLWTQAAITDWSRFRKTITESLLTLIGSPSPSRPSGAPLPL